MTRWRLILRTLLHFRAVNIAAALGVAVATACLSGALMVGDSVRASLIDLALTRLGRIDHVLVSPRFFDASLAERIKTDSRAAGVNMAPGILVKGGATRQGSDVYMPRMQVLAAGSDWAPVDRGQCVINDEAADALGASVGDDLVISIPKDAGLSREATLARRSREDTLSGIRARVAKIVNEPGMISRFSLEGSQRAPSNIWVNLADLQDAVDQRGRANIVFVADPVRVGADVLNDAMRRVVTTADYGLTQKPSADGREIAAGSRLTYVDPPIERTAERIADSLKLPMRKVTVNLLNAVSRVGADGGATKTIHYAVAAGITPLDEQKLAADEVAINQWTADQLGAGVGDQLRFRFYRRQPDGGLAEATEVDRGIASLRIARILPMSGIGADPSLTPEYEGLTNTESIADWDPPEGVTIDQKLVTDADEAYWKQHRASPKVFVSYETALALWGESYAQATSLRVPKDGAAEFGKALEREIDPASVGLSFVPIRQQQLAAASGTTDFGQLFIGFSFFLIIAAVLLVAMLMRLAVEQRSRQFGAMSAVGFSPSSLRKLLLSEGLIVSIVGGVIGSALAVGYTWFMIAGLRTWWRGAVGTNAMRLHVEPLTLAIGFIVTQLIAAAAIAWAIRAAGRAAPARLLAGATEAIRSSAGGGKSRVVAVASAVAGIAAVGAGIAGGIGEQAAFMLGGTLLLIAGVALAVSSLTPRAPISRAHVTSIVALARRNASRHPTRSALCVGLIALAAFAIVTVSAMRQGEPSDTADAQSGAGGNQIMVEADIPLLGNPATELGRTILGFRDPADAIWNRIRFTPLLRRAGQDVSCQTLTRATSPSILGVSQEMIARGGFRFASTTEQVENPWTLLDGAPSDGSIPIIADANTAQYSLHVSLGDTIDVLDSNGTTRRLRLVGTLAGSIFQSELLMSEGSFRSLFPGTSGYGTVLVRAEPADEAQVTKLLRDELAEYAARVRTTASVLATFLEVQNTYLSTFQLLAALGLMLGTIGLAVVLVRTVLERRSELALLGAIGFRSSSRVKLVLAESLMLLLAGVSLGTISAMIGVLPALRESARAINWMALLLSLAATVLIGVVASSLAAVAVGRTISPAALRSE